MLAVLLLCGTKYVWGRAAQLLTMGDTSHVDRLYLPQLPFAFSTGVPGADPAGAARRTFANVLHRGTRPARRRRHPPHQPGVDQVGVQGAHASGMLLVEGMYVAPCIPDHLIDAPKDLRNLAPY